MPVHDQNTGKIAVNGIYGEGKRRWSLDILLRRGRRRRRRLRLIECGRLSLLELPHWCVYLVDADDQAGCYEAERDDPRGKFGASLAG